MMETQISCLEAQLALLKEADALDRAVIARARLRIKEATARILGRDREVNRLLFVISEARETDEPQHAQSRVPITRAILEILRREGRPVTRARLVAETGAAANVVGATLTHLKRRGQVARAGHGEWELGAGPSADNH